MQISKKETELILHDYNLNEEAYYNLKNVKHNYEIDECFVYGEVIIPTNFYKNESLKIAYNNDKSITDIIFDYAEGKNIKIVDVVIQESIDFNSKCFLIIKYESEISKDYYPNPDEK